MTYFLIPVKVTSNLLQNRKKIFSRHYIIVMESDMLEMKEMNINMIEEYFEILQKFIVTDRGRLGKEIIERKEKELGYKFPESMVEFYNYYGKNSEILNSFYTFDKIDNLRIENDGLIFGSTYRNIALLGIALEDLDNGNPVISKYMQDLDNWFVESIFADSFFFNIACWQILNQMPSIARVKMKEDKLDCLCESEIIPICKEKTMKKGYDIISCQNKEENLLMCFLREAGELHIASMKDEYLEEFKNEWKEDFIWL